MKWQCQGNPNDHHSVIQCAPDKIPQLAPNQVCNKQHIDIVWEPPSTCDIEIIITILCVWVPEGGNIVDTT